MILFLFGEDSFSSSHKLGLIKSRFLANHDVQNLVTYSADQLEGVDLASIFDTQSLWAGHRLIIFRDILADAGAPTKDKLKEILSRDLDPNLTIIFWETGTFDRRQSLYKFLNQPKAAQEFVAPVPAQMPARAKSLAEEVGINLSQPELQKIINTVGTDLWLLHSELTKLGYCPPELRQELISPSQQSVAFALQDAITTNQPGEALHVLSGQIAHGDDFALIIGSLAGTLRNLIRIAELTSKNKSSRDIAVTTGIHPYVVSKLTHLASTRSVSDWIAQYRQLSQLDWQIKTGAVESDSALEFATVSFF